MNEIVRYKDRTQAGNILAKDLMQFRSDENIIILALPRGGVPVGYVVAQKLNKPFNIFVVKKIGAPDQEELAIGAISSSGDAYINYELVDRLGIGDKELQELIEIKKSELKDREFLLRGNSKSVNIHDKSIILVDDGLATGATMLTAIGAIKKLLPKKIIVAIPVASHEAINIISHEVDEVICPLVPDFFYSVGIWYEDFRQTTDGEVITLLKHANQEYESSNIQRKSIL